VNLGQLGRGGTSSFARECHDIYSALHMLGLVALWQHLLESVCIALLAYNHSMIPLCFYCPLYQDIIVELISLLNACDYTQIYLVI